MLKAVTKVSVFEYADSKVRTVWKDDQAWWVAKDVCDILGLPNVGQAVASLDDDEKSKITNNDLGRSGGHDSPIVNEPGLYSLILRSRKPEAKAFKRWVTHEVLPTIRKTGMYADKRNKSRITRNWFTATLQRHGYEKPYEYIQTTKQMKRELHIDVPKDEMQLAELMAITAAESLSSLRIMKSGARGYHEVNPLCVDSSRMVEQASMCHEITS